MESLIGKEEHFLEELIGRYGREKSALMPILNAIQRRYNYLPRDLLSEICRRTKINTRQITEASTFFKSFRLEPSGNNSIKVCIGTACHLKGAESVFIAFRRHLGLEELADTDSTGLFTVKKVACLGCCMLAPVVQINQRIYGHVTPFKVPFVVADFLAAKINLNADGFGIDGSDGIDPVDGEVKICTCSSCTAAGADLLYLECLNVVERYELSVRVLSVTCPGLSYTAPLLEVVLASGRRFWHVKISKDDVTTILFSYFSPSRIGKKILAGFDNCLEKIYSGNRSLPLIQHEANFCGEHDSLAWFNQTRIATENAGSFSSFSLNSYKKHHGFEALKNVIEMNKPEQVIAMLEKSGLRGRGGAGYPTYLKWQSVFSSMDETKYIIANGDEGDPGAFMDRMLIESFPYRIIEGMLIAAFTLAITKGFIYIRNEYPLAIIRMSDAIRKCEAAGMLGECVMGKSFSFSLTIIEGAGAFVCGEETALIASLEGKRPAPRVRPPFPSKAGLYSKPTLVQNVETLALLPWILRNGPEAFTAYGTNKSTGTKIFALAGRVRRGGLVEVPMGMTIKEIIMEVGGGIQGDGEFKAVQIGGPSGGCIPAMLADTPIDYEALAVHGSMMGSGGMIVLDQTDCLVDIARYFMSFMQAESCGKCIPCRRGTKMMLEMLEKLCMGQAQEGVLGELESLGAILRETSLCGLGKTAANPVLTSLRYFRDEYEAHLAGECPARRCKQLIEYFITSRCIGCTRCAQGCPVKAIPLTPHQRHVIDTNTCIRCNTCREVCPSHAVEVQGKGDKMSTGL